MPGSSVVPLLSCSPSSHQNTIHCIFFNTACLMRAGIMTPLLLHLQTLLLAR